MRVFPVKIILVAIRKLIWNTDEKTTEISVRINPTLEFYFHLAVYLQTPYTGGVSFYLFIY